MVREQAISTTVDRALLGAAIEPDGTCAFEPAALQAVVRLCDSETNLHRVLEAVDEALGRAVEELEQDRTMAAIALRTRIAAATEYRPLAVENIEGQVGAGGGRASSDEG